MSFVVNGFYRCSFIKTSAYSASLTYLLAAVTEEVLVHRLVAILVVELGAHGVAGAGNGQQLLDVTDRRPPVALLGPHPELQPHISSPSWVTLWCQEPLSQISDKEWNLGDLSNCGHSLAHNVCLLYYP